jgi:signal transduction histidine kinase
MEVDEVRADLDRIRQSSTHLLSLISNILDLSKVEAGRMEIFCEPVDLSAVVQEAVAVVAPQLRDRGNELHVDLPDDLPVLHTDLTKLRQCLLNLLSNAVKFTQNGRIDLRVREVDIGQLQVEVEDTGVGMTPAQLDRLFQEFSQADASTTRRYGGTGLGLALSRHLLELIGGHIHVRSEYGRGTCFTIDLPTRLATPTGAGLRVVRLEQLKAPRAERIDDGAGAAAR